MRPVAITRFFGQQISQPAQSTDLHLVDYTVKPVLRDHCHERPPVLTDHIFMWSIEWPFKIGSTVHCLVFSRMHEFRRDLQELIGTKANLNLGPTIQNYGGETFLSQEVAINILQESKLAFKRCKLVSAVIVLGE